VHGGAPALALPSGITKRERVRPGTASAHSGRGHSIDLRALQPRGIIFACSDPTHQIDITARAFIAAPHQNLHAASNQTQQRTLERYIALVYDVFNAIKLTNSQFT
jgi:hypothetical protein